MDERTKPGNNLLEYLAERDVPCPGCGYNLRNLTGALCPECGKPAISVFARPWWRFTEIERVFVWGAAFSTAGVAAWVVAIVCMATDALWVIAMWVPALMLLVLAIVVSTWTASLIYVGRRHPRIAMANAVVVWGLGTVYAAMLMLLLLS